MSPLLLDIEELVEYEPKSLPRGRISDEIERVLCEHYDRQVGVEAPQYRTGHQWRLMSKGWAGYIPITSEFGLRLIPKVGVGNLFGMLEYAYRLKSFRFLDDLIGCQSLEDYYDRLASILAKRILDRGRKGYYRDYLARDEQMPYVCGRLDVVRSTRMPWDIRLSCHFQEHTADIEENQILAWTLWEITRRGGCTEQVLTTVRQAYRSLQGLTTLQPFSPAKCYGRRYNRLNQDYHPMHAMCRFFLEQTGPSHRVGDREIMPFLVNMEGLFEMFVAEWLKSHLPSRWVVKAQERLLVGIENDLHYDIDLAIYDTETPRIAYVLDTKYKAAGRPSARDIQQVQAYAHARTCSEAVLIYPVTLSAPVDIHIRDIRVRGLVFSLTDNLEDAGQRFLNELLNS